MTHTPKTRSIAFLGDHLPRRCGIATFTADICEAVAGEFPEAECIVGSVNDRPEGYEYPPRVRFEIAEQELDSYNHAAADHCRNLMETVRTTGRGYTEEAPGCV
jgi:hypothetical protein